MRALFTVTIFLGSLLLFLVQPLVTKMILPYFGGVPAVWNTSLVFFQAVLLLGYAYSHFGPKLLGPKAHLAVHVGLFLLAIVFLPFTIAADFNPVKSGLPTPIALLGFLCVVVGLPYFAVSTGAPLLQKWFARTDDPNANDPYFLYAASNIGSVAALLMYPFWFESQFRIAEQALIFKWGFIGLALLVAICGAVSLRTVGAEATTVATDPPKWAQRIRWILLAAAPTSLLLGVTNYLTTNLASIPLLWVVPLTLYLVTFILAFRSKPFLSSEKWGRWAALLMAPMAMILVLEATEPFIALAVVHLTVFFFAALACHSELAESRPAADHLTEFYLFMSLGGVLGGAFNAFVAPLIFKSLAEYPIALVAIAALRAKPSETKWSIRELAMPVSVLVVTLGMWFVVQAMGMGPSQQRTALTMGLPAILCFISIDKPIRYALSLGCFLFLASHLGLSRGGALIYNERSFFGVHRIIEPANTTFRQLTHGNTIHGRQNLNPKYHDTPLTYYYPTGPIGETIAAYQKVWPEAKFGFVGLGVGSLAAYGRASDRITYFEIDPVVIEIAKNPKFFTFLSNCKSKLDIVLGDARLSLRDQPDSSYDMIALDAFSSDSIPVHLLTNEAIAMYLSKLTPRGVLAVHISNRYLDLAPVLAAAAREMKLQGRSREESEFPMEEFDIGKSPSHWLILAKSNESLAPIDAINHWMDLQTVGNGRSWTDDRSNILETWHRD